MRELRFTICLLVFFALIGAAVYCLYLSEFSHPLWYAGSAVSFAASIWWCAALMGGRFDKFIGD